jgi:hypothetical protein
MVLSIITLWKVEGLVKWKVKLDKKKDSLRGKSFLIFVKVFSLFAGNDVDEFASFGFGGELDLAFRSCEEGMVFSHADIVTGVELGSSLADDDIAGDD